MPVRPALAILVFALGIVSSACAAAPVGKASGGTVRQDSSTSVAPSHCPNCGVPTQMGDKFCGGCGTSFQQSAGGGVK